MDAMRRQPKAFLAHAAHDDVVFVVPADVGSGRSAASRRLLPAVRIRPRKFLRDSPCVFAFSMIAPFLTIRSASFACVIREYRKAQGRIQRRGATMRNRCSTMRHAVRCDASVRTGARGTGLLGGRIQPARNRMLRSTAVGIPATEPPFVYCHRSKSNCPVGTATSYSANQTGRLPNALLPKRAMSCLFP